MFDSRESLSVTQDGDRLYAKARQDGVETVWERHQAQQPQCGFCDMGLELPYLHHGPLPGGSVSVKGPRSGVCGADADIIVARNLCRMVAAGAASHSDHGRDLVEVLAGVADGSALGYKIRDEAKLKRLAEEYGVAVPRTKAPLTIAGELAQAMMEDYGMRQKAIKLVSRAPQKAPGDLGKVQSDPRGIDRETSEMLHRTHMGVDNNWQTCCCRPCATPCPTAGAGR
jgi:carbon-monoxide dehydrogenase catalytic subunit